MVEGNHPSIPTIALAVLLVVTLLVASTATAAVFEKNEDSSGNGHHLTENGDLSNATSSFDKFPDGYNVSEGNLTQTDQVFNDTDGMAVSAALRLGERASVFANGETANPWSLSLDSFGTVTALFQDEGGFGHQCNLDEVETDPGEVSAAATFDVGLATTIDVRAWLPNGELHDSRECMFTETPGSDFQEVFIGPTTVFIDPPTKTAVFDARFWTTPNEDAFTVADPSESLGTLEPIGSEEAVWLMQKVEDSVAEAEKDGGTVSVWEDVTDGEVEIWAQPLNETGAKVEPRENLTLLLERVDQDAGIVRSWNESDGSFTQPSTLIEMEPVSQTLFNATFNRTDLAGSDLRVTIFAPITEVGTGDNATLNGDLNVLVEETTTETLSHEPTDLQQFASLTALELAWFAGMAALGVIIWSKSLDGGIRAFGAFLPIIAGLLMLAFGTDQGFGNLWEGHLGFSITLLVIGLYMLIRLFLDILAEEDQEATVT